MRNSETYYCVLAVLVNKKEELLLIKRTDNGCWGFVEGGILFGEKPENAMRREIKEEVGLDVNSITSFSLVSWTYNDGEKREHIVAMIYLCNVVSTKLKLNPAEVADYCWIGYNETGILKDTLTKRSERFCYGFEEVMRTYQSFKGNLVNSDNRVLT